MGIGGSSLVLCEEVVVFVVEEFPLWWFVGMPIANGFPCFLGQVEYLFDACNNNTFYFVS